MWDPYDPYSYLIHVTFGFTAVAGAIVALYSQKGSRLHIIGGRTFAVTMVVASSSALVFVIKDFRPLVIVMSVATLYLLATAVLAIRSSKSDVPLFEKVLIVIPVVLFLVSAATLARSVVSMSIAQIPGPALYATVFLCLAIGDLRVIRSRPAQRIVWIKRHLLRMLLAFAFAIRALFSIGIDVGIPFEVAVTAPIVLALLAAFYFFARLERLG